MEPNISSSPATWTSSPVAILEHGEPNSMLHEPSLLSPAFFPTPSPSLLPAPGSGSESSLYQQFPPSPDAMAVKNGSLSVHSHVTSSSLQSMPSSCFPATDSDKLPMVGYDLFRNPKVMTTDTPLPTLLGNLWGLGDSSLLMAAPVLPDCPSPGLFGFASEFAPAWLSKEMSSPFFWSSSSAGGLAPPQSSDNLVGFVQPSSDSETEPLPQTLRTPLSALAVQESPVVDDPMPPVEEDKEIDVSAFLVSDPDGQLPKALCTVTGPLMGNGTGGGACASWMAPGSTSNNWSAAAASMYTMVSTSSGSVACLSGSSSIGAMMVPPSSPMLPLVLPSPQGVGASSSNFNSFAQPPSSSVLASLAPNLQGPPRLPVKQEVMEMEYDDRHPDFISLDNEEDGLYQDAIFGSWGSNSSSPTSFAPGSWGGGGSSSRSIAPGRWGSSSSGPGFRPGSWGGGGSMKPSFASGSWGSSTGSPCFASSSWGGGSSSSSPNFRPSFTGSMLCFDQSTSIDNYDGSSWMQIRGKMASIPGMPPLPRAGIRASTSNGGAGIVFTDPEMAIIAKDKKLQELLRTDAKKLKRVLYNRAYSAVAKVRRVMHTKNLERMVVTLEETRKSLCEELQSLKEGSATLRAQQMKMQMTIDELEQQTMLKDVVREGLRADIENLKHLTWLTYKLDI